MTHAAAWYRTMASTSAWDHWSGLSGNWVAPVTRGWMVPGLFPSFRWYTGTVGMPTRWRMVLAVTSAVARAPPCLSGLNIQCDPSGAVWIDLVWAPPRLMVGPGPKDQLATWAGSGRAGRSARAALWCCSEAINCRCLAAHAPEPAVR